MLPFFRNAGEANSRNTEYQFWRQDNHPIELYSSAFIVQRITYIRQNPVRAGIVEKAEEYRYSSARDYFEGRKCGLIDICIFVALVCKVWEASVFKRRQKLRKTF